MRTLIALLIACVIGLAYSSSVTFYQNEAEDLETRINAKLCRRTALLDEWVALRQAGMTEAADTKKAEADDLYRDIEADRKVLNTLAGIED